MSNQTEIQEQFTNYLSCHKDLVQLRKQQKELKAKLDGLEKNIMEYMTKNDMDSISLKEGEIILYTKKIPQMLKKESIVEKLTEELQDPNKAEKLTDKIFHNKKFITEDKLRAVIKKK